MKWLTQRSLKRRILLCLLGASLALWSSCVGVFWVVEHQASKDGIEGFARWLSKSLTEIKDPAEVKRIVALVGGLRGVEDLRFKLDLTGVVVLDSDRSLVDQTGDLPAVIWQKSFTGLSQTKIGPNLYRSHCVQGPRWIVVATIRSEDLTGVVKLGVVFLTIMITLMTLLFAPQVWWAVHIGLKPLRRLTTAVTSRSSSDLSALQIPVQYTDLQPLQDELNNLLARLRTALAREKAFVQDCAHELRTPLAVILAQAHVLVTASTAESRHEAIQRLQRALLRTTHLSHQLLQLAQLEVSEATHLPLDVMNIVRDAIAEITERAMSRDVEVTLTGPEQMPCAADPQALQCIIDNLLDNALKYGPQPGQIEVTVQVTQGGVLLQVADDGPGMPADLSGKAFERFRRMPSAIQAGSGLGLAIVKQAAMSMNGTATLNPGINGQGCCFEVQFEVRSLQGG